jgi:ATP phosphoribosyltransferase
MEKLRIAIQKSGRLSEQSLGIIKEAGIKLTNGRRNLLSQATSFPIEILYLRDDDIPQYVEDNVADIGFVGEDVFREKGKNLDITLRMGFSKCRLSLAVPKTTDYNGLDWFNHKKIATSFPNILRSFLDKKGIQADIHEISGSVEIAPGIGLADSICDIVSSGSTLISNGLKEVEVILDSEAIMISNSNLSEAKLKIRDEFIFRLQAVLASRDNKYILLNAPNANLDRICGILPGMKSPTIMPLAEPGWSSVHSVVNEKTFWEVIGQLRNEGAQGILVIPIEKMIL